MKSGRLRFFGGVLAALAALGGPPGAGAATVTFQNGTATCSQNDVTGNYAVDEAVDGVINTSDGWSIFCNGSQALAQTAVFETAFDVPGPGTLHFVFNQSFNGPTHTMGRFRLSATTAPRADFADGLNDGGNLGLDAIWTVLDPVSATSTGGAILTEQGDNSILASGTNPSTAIYTVVVQTSLSGITGIRLELLEDASLPFMGPGRQTTNGNLVLTEMSVEACQEGLLDLDDDGSILPLTDGLLFLRYLFGFRGATLIASATGGSCGRCLATEIETYIAGILNAVDVDGDGTTGVLTDGLLLFSAIGSASGEPL